MAETNQTPKESSGRLSQSIAHDKQTATPRQDSKAKHTPGDVNHQFLAAGGHNYCYECGVPLRGQAKTLNAELLQTLKCAQEELRLLRMKDTAVVYDVGLRARIDELIAKVEGGAA